MTVAIKKSLSIFISLMIMTTMATLFPVKSEAVTIPKTGITTMASTKVKTVTVKWKKLSNVTGYVLKIGTNKSLTQNVVKIYLKSPTFSSYTLKNIKGNKTYYARLYTYKVINKKTYYSGASAVKSAYVKNSLSYDISALRSFYNRENTSLSLAAKIKNNNGKGYTAYSYYDYNKFINSVNRAKTVHKQNYSMIQKVKTAAFQKAYKNNKNYTYTLAGKKYTKRARQAYQDLYYRLRDNLNNTNTARISIKKKTISSAWPHYKTIKDGLDSFASKYFKSGMTSKEKAMIIYKFVCDKISYSYTNPNKYGYDVWDADTVLYRVFSSSGKIAGVCGTYACAFQMISQYFGFTSNVVASSNHVWNQIQLDGKWYVMDLTNGDETIISDPNLAGNVINKNPQKYFSKFFYLSTKLSDSFIAEHTPTEMFSSYYYFFIKPTSKFKLVSKCNSLNYTFIKL